MNLMLRMIPDTPGCTTPGLGRATRRQYDDSNKGVVPGTRTLKRETDLIGCRGTPTKKGYQIQSQVFSGTPVHTTEYRH